MAERKFKNSAVEKAFSNFVENTFTDVKGEVITTHKVGDIIDGIDSIKTYVLVAVKGDKYIAVGRIPHGGKIKFYPNAQSWGLADKDVIAYGGVNQKFRPNYGYERWMMSLADVKTLLTRKGIYENLVVSINDIMAGNKDQKLLE